jgi:hypothetical protein
MALDFDKERMANLPKIHENRKLSLKSGYPIDFGDVTKMHDDFKQPLLSHGIQAA